MALSIFRDDKPDADTPLQEVCQSDIMYIKNLIAEITALPQSSVIKQKADWFYSVQCKVHCRSKSTETEMSDELKRPWGFEKKSRFVATV